MLGIDVSENNGEIDWDAVVDAGVQFVIVRCTYGKYEQDEMFIDNIVAAKEHGLLVGAYHYSYALSGADAVMEAENCKEALDECGVELDLPVFFDMEDADNYKRNHFFSFNEDDITEICQCFCDNVGYENVGVYASYSWFTDYIDYEGKGWKLWNAQWGNYDDMAEQDYMWQFTDELEIGGKWFDGNRLEMV